MNRPTKAAPSVFSRLARRERRMRSSGEALALVYERLGGQDQAMLVALWNAWPSVMGEFLSSLGQPRGHKDATLIIGAYDSIAMQELTMLSEEILERANEFLKTTFFTAVHTTLMQGEKSLSRDKARAPRTGQNAEPSAHSAAPLPFDAPRIGALMGRLSPDSPITRCYEAHVKTPLQSAQRKPRR
ncbi:DUF721 domain-containing protein [Desulfovibrio sp. OttesenSCG-928-G15]|nr:DUF721 domain-containing protein [Desulfovibrio sp. OttesenSCG-928-G15]